MRLPKFTYFTPRSLTEACRLLDKYGSKSTVIAGGSDLLVKMKDGVTSPKYLIGLRSIKELDYIDSSKPEGLKIGALTTLSAIANSPIINEKINMLFQATNSMANVQIRNSGTIGGNICNASPSADTLPPLIAANALVKLISPTGERTVSLESFLSGVGQTVLKQGEILTEIQVPLCAYPWKGIYLKHTFRSACDIAAVNVGLFLVHDEHMKCQECRIVIGAVAPTPIRAKRAENAIINKVIDSSLINKVGRLATEDICPISDIRCSADYRTEITRVIVCRAISQAVG